MDNSGFIRPVISKFTPAVATVSVTPVADTMFSVASLDATCFIFRSRLHVHRRVHHLVNVLDLGHLHHLLNSLDQGDLSLHQTRHIQRLPNALWHFRCFLQFEKMGSSLCITTGTSTTLSLYCTFGWWTFSEKFALQVKNSVAQLECLHTWQKSMS